MISIALSTQNSQGSWLSVPGLKPIKQATRLFVEQKKYVLFCIRSNQETMSKLLVNQLFIHLRNFVSVFFLLIKAPSILFVYFRDDEYWFFFELKAA